MGGCDLIGTARGTLLGGNMRRRRQETESSTQKTQATETGSVTLAQVFPSQL